VRVWCGTTSGQSKSYDATWETHRPLATSGGFGGHAVVSGGRRSSYQLEALAGSFSASRTGWSPALSSPFSSRDGRHAAMLRGLHHVEAVEPPKKSPRGDRLSAVAAIKTLDDLVSQEGGSAEVRLECSRCGSSLGTYLASSAPGTEPDGPFARFVGINLIPIGDSRLKRAWLSPRIPYFTPRGGLVQYTWPCSCNPGAGPLRRADRMGSLVVDEEHDPPLVLI
jgi:hypothetical protein